MYERSWLSALTAGAVVLASPAAALACGTCAAGQGDAASNSLVGLAVMMVLPVFVVGFVAWGIARLSAATGPTS